MLVHCTHDHPKLRRVAFDRQQLRRPALRTDRVADGTEDGALADTEGVQYERAPGNELPGTNSMSVTS